MFSIAFEFLKPWWSEIFGTLIFTSMYYAVKSGVWQAKACAYVYGLTWLLTTMKAALGMPQSSLWMSFVQSGITAYVIWHLCYALPGQPRAPKWVIHPVGVEAAIVLSYILIPLIGSTMQYFVEAGMFLYGCIFLLVKSVALRNAHISGKIVRKVLELFISIFAIFSVITVLT